MNIRTSTIAALAALLLAGTAALPTAASAQGRGWEGPRATVQYRQANGYRHAGPQVWQHRHRHWAPVRYAPRHYYGPAYRDRGRGQVDFVIHYGTGLR